MKKPAIYLILPAIMLIVLAASVKPKVTTIYLAGDSTVADYSGDYEKRADYNYLKERYPVMGWGQVFQEFMASDSLHAIRNLVRTDSVFVDNRARGGRSTRTFFQEGRWRSINESLKKGDIVMMQFGHNDAAENKPERYVDIEGYKEFLRLYIDQTLQQDAIPIVLSAVNRNYPWKDGKLSSSHGAYQTAAIEVAQEKNIRYIDLTELSVRAFQKKGKDYVTDHYFMNLPPGKFEAYPDGQSDNTHFQPEGARAVAQVVYNAMKNL